mmetsp:Transcript_46071/g.103318  ORF Transcript_46071/g.103318 Transcript_46071/m.103318 type:complete len:232 (-) Transcript_46071:776-1471(-)
MVTIGEDKLESPPGPKESFSMLTVPSGLCSTDRRTACENGTGEKPFPKSFLLWNTMYSAKSAGETSFPIAATTCLRNIASTYSTAQNHCDATLLACIIAVAIHASVAVASLLIPTIVASMAACFSCKALVSSASNWFKSIALKRAVPEGDPLLAIVANMTEVPSTGTAGSAAAAPAATSCCNSGSTGTKHVFNSPSCLASTFLLKSGSIAMSFLSSPATCEVHLSYCAKKV